MKETKETKETKKAAGIVILAVLFVAVLIGAAKLFPTLSDAYKGNNGTETATVSATENTTETTAANVSETEETEAPPTDPAADFTVYDGEGNAVKLSDFAGRPTVVNFWATWCGYCVQELPEFNALCEEYGDRVHFVMLDLCDGFRETQTRAAAYIKSKGYTFPVYYDTDFDASDKYAVTGIPMTLFVDAQGSLAQTYTGMMDADTLRNQIEALLNGAN